MKDILSTFRRGKISLELEISIVRRRWIVQRNLEVLPSPTNLITIFDTFAFFVFNCMIQQFCGAVRKCLIQPSTVISYRAEMQLRIDLISSLPCFYRRDTLIAILFAGSSEPGLFPSARSLNIDRELRSIWFRFLYQSHVQIRTKLVCFFFRQFIASLQALLRLLNGSVLSPRYKCFYIDQWSSHN